MSASSITIGSHQPLSGPAAPGYDEIAPAARAFFRYVNAHGGVYGRRIHLIYRDDGYDPARTVKAVRQLVLHSKVFAIFDGLGTATHEKVVGFLNASKVPDLFVGSGCACWDGQSAPYTFGWPPNYTIEGKILGRYVKQHFPGQTVGVLYQDDDFGRGGLAGIESQIPAGQIVAKEAYQPGTPTLAPQITTIKTLRAKVLIDFTLPAYTAMGELTAFTLGYKPQLVVSSVGIDPTTVGGLLKTISKGQVSGTGLIEGAITDGYLPSIAERSNPWIALFKRVHDQYDPGAPFDSNVEYGMASAYTLVQALKAAGKNLTRRSLIDAIQNGGGKWAGPGLVPFRYTKTQHGGYGGAEIGQIRGGEIVLFGGPLTTDPSPTGAITPYAASQAAPPAGGVP